MNNENKSQQQAHSILHARLLYLDCNGQIRDVTQDEDKYGFGLKSLQQLGANAADELVRIDELLDVLALAAENRSQIDAALVRRVLQEVGTCLDQSGDLASYVRHTQ